MSLIIRPVAPLPPLTSDARNLYRRTTMSNKTNPTAPVIIENSRIHDINRTAYASVAIYGNVNKTMENLEAAFAGESMAHIKYRYFARLARAAGDGDTARTFEETADQEVMHAFGHLDLLYPKDTITPARALEIAIAGETYEYTEMYPKFRETAVAEGNRPAIAEIDEQIEESKEHAHRFKATLEKAAKRFAALAAVEKRHAAHYSARLAAIQ
jgi:rubrerythrin